MGTIIRKNVFETNSSSTHTITILNNSTKNLIQNGVLHPELLSDYVIYTDSYNDAYILKCDTYELKLAILVHWLKFYELYDDYIDFQTLIERLRQISKIDINFDFEYCKFNQYSEYGHDIEIQTIDKLEDFYYNIVCKDNKIIMEKYVENY